MSYKLVIGNTVEVPVRVKLNDGGKEETFEFRLVCTRLTADEISARMKDMDKPVKAILAEVVKGWEGQKLVVDEAGTPAPFNMESFEMMLGISGMPVLLFNAYLKESGAKEKN